MMSNEYPPPTGSGPDPDEPSGPPPDQPPPPPPPYEGQQPDQPAYGGQQGAYGQGYGGPTQPPPGYYPPDAYGGKPKTSPMAVVSLVLGIVGVCCGQLFLISIGAIVTGAVSRRQIKESGGLFTGGPMALAGMILGGIGLLVGVLYWIGIATGVIDTTMTFGTP